MDKFVSCGEDIILISDFDGINSVLRKVIATVISPYGYLYSESSLHISFT